MRDIERILDYVDFDGTGFFSIRQVGQILVLLKVFKCLFVEKKEKPVSKHKRTFDITEEERLAREEEFLMQFWYLLNPLGDREKIEGRILYVFLKLVYDPYWDGLQETMQQMINEASKLVAEIKQLCRE